MITHKLRDDKAGCFIQGIVNLQGHLAASATAAGIHVAAALIDFRTGACHYTSVFAELGRLYC